MAEHKQWFVTDYFKRFLAFLMLMANQMSAVALEQMRIVGQFFDAKHLLEQTRAIQELQVEANKDYHPSESFCWWGTNTRSLADSELRGRFNQKALSRITLARMLGNDNNGAAEPSNNLSSRWSNFRETYCDPHDNGWRNTTGDNGLQSICRTGDLARANNDVDYTRMIEYPRTLEVNFHPALKSPAGGGGQPGIAELTPNEEDILALSSNLYGHRTFERVINGLNTTGSNGHIYYFLLRSVAAKRAVAQESFNAIVGLKSQAQEGDVGSVKPYLAALVRNAGMEKNAEEIFRYLGERPSYYAQLEVLAKKIAQSPDFFVNLVDKPANIKRKKAAMNAIELMLDRAIYESELRQEMILSVLLASVHRNEYDDIFSKLPTPYGEKEGTPGG